MVTVGIKISPRNIPKNQEMLKKQWLIITEQSIQNITKDGIKELRRAILERTRYRSGDLSKKITFQYKRKGSTVFLDRRTNIIIETDPVHRGAHYADYVDRGTRMVQDGRFIPKINRKNGGWGFKIKTGTQKGIKGRRFTELAAERTQKRVVRHIDASLIKPLTQAFKRTWYG